MKYTRFVKSEWEKLFSEDFSFLKSIPSSDILARIALINAHKDIFTKEFLCKYATNRTSILKEMIEKIRLMHSEEVNRFSYMPVRKKKLMAQKYLSQCKDDEEKEMLKQFLKAHENVYTPSAAETRKGFFPVIEEEFNGTFKNNGGGCWSIPIPFNDRFMNLVIDCGGRFSTMRYWIDVFPEMKPEKTVFIAYEKIMGFYDPDWDLMHVDTLAQHAETFVEIVNRTVNALNSKYK